MLNVLSPFPHCSVFAYFWKIPKNREGFCCPEFWMEMAGFAHPMRSLPPPSDTIRRQSNICQVPFIVSGWNWLMTLSAWTALCVCAWTACKKAHGTLITKTWHNYDSQFIFSMFCLPLNLGPEDRTFWLHDLSTFLFVYILSPSP